MTRAIGVLWGCTMLVVVLALGAAAASADEAVDGCLPTFVSVGGAVSAAAGLDAEQAANARLIVSTVVRRRLPTRAAVIALATAMQESGLRNIPYGDRDSVGLFQQRPSQGWGDLLSIMSPTRATNAFLDRLQTVPAWPLLPLTRTAQEVQRSGHPDAYAQWESPATAIAAALLGRPAGRSHERQDAAEVPDTSAPPSRCGDAYGGYARVPVGDCGFPAAPARSCGNAIRWALAQSDGAPAWHRLCLHFVARAYGYATSGTPTAAAFWATARERHVADPAPPPGALVFWDTGDPAGHVALAAGDGLVISNDIGGPGTISLVPMTEIGTRWHAAYLGWTPPVFPHGT